jgi:amino acid adenylation domain-containing protein
LGEIESQLLRHPGINQALVLAREDGRGDKYLCAYIVSNSADRFDKSALISSELRKHLVQSLPDYMIPSYFVNIEQIPLTSSGKIDRKALPKPEPEVGQDYIAPRDVVEGRLVELWSGVLGIEKHLIGIDFNFFELGGHSLKATILIAGIHKELDVKLPLAEVFKTPTVSGLAKYIREAEKKRYVSIVPLEKKEYYALSSAQKRLYILQQMDLDNTVYNMPYLLPLPGEFDINQLEQTFIQLIHRHESLRTSFQMVQDEPVQKIQPLGELEFHIQLYHSDIGHTRQQWVQPFDLSRPPLVRVLVSPHREGRYLLMLDMHHIISDGLSHQILQRDFVSLYNAEQLPPLVLQYKDYAEWQCSLEQQSLLKHQEAFWMDVFSDELPVLNLPIDYPRPLIQSFEGRSVNFLLTGKETQTLKNIAAQTDTTLYMVILSVYTILLSKLSTQEDIIVGTPIAARRHVDLASIVGMFVNTIAIRNFPTAEKTFASFLSEVKGRALNAFENQEYQFEDLVDQLSPRRDTSRNPIFDVMFNLLNQLDFQGNVPEFDEQDSNSNQLEDSDEYRNDTSKFDLNLTAWDMEQRLFFNLEYCTRLFKEKTIEKIIGYFRKLLSVLSLYVNRLNELTISDMEILSRVEKEEILAMCRGLEEAAEEHKTLHQWFEGQATQTPHRIAVAGAGLSPSPAHANPAELSLTYQELNRKANQLANVLRKKGICSNSPVGLMVERSFEMIIAILGILKTGGAYLPIDTQYPGERKKYLLQDCDVKLLLTNYQINNAVSYIPNGVEIVDISAENIYEGPFNNPGSRSVNSDLVYVIYTSGSTGSPKGVMIEHRNLVNLFKFHFKYTNLNSSKVLQFTTISFDVSYQEIFSTLLSGGELYLVDNETRTNVPDLFNIIEKHGISTLFLPMSFLRLIFNEDDYIQLIPGSIRHIQTAGEQVVISNRFKEYLKKNNVFLHNHYGPSETHVVTTLTLEPGGDIPELPSIGKPILNTAIYILNKVMQLLPVGVSGELFIGGLQVGRGYLNNPALTNNKFLAVHFGHSINAFGGENKKEPGKKNYRSHMSYIYKTGDIGRWLPGDNIEFIGRKDFQVKIRGFRIELEEIEIQLLNHKEVKEVKVLAWEQPETQDKYLVAYFVPGGSVGEPGLKDCLKESLPYYMVPQYFISLEKMPLTLNGKVDVRALPEPGAVTGAAFIAPRDTLEKKLAEIWTGVLREGQPVNSPESAPIGIDDNFFELGGHSLKATILATKIHQHLNVRFPLVEVFKTPSIRLQAEYINSHHVECVIPSLIDTDIVLLKKGSSKTKPLFFIHDGSGEVEGYVEFCQHFDTGSDFNCWGIQADKVKNYAPQNTTIKKIASKYMEKIKSLQPQGPYFIIGWSIGGTIAFEMARQLEEINEKIAFLALIDSGPPQKALRRYVSRFDLKSELKWVMKLLPDKKVKQKIRRISENHQLWKFIVDYLENNGVYRDWIFKIHPHIPRIIPDFDRLGLKELIQRINLIRTLESASYAYIPPGKIHTTINFFKASESEFNQQTWNNYCQKPMKLHKIHGDHFSIFQLHHMVPFAKTFNEILKNQLEK